MSSQSESGRIPWSAVWRTSMGYFVLAWFCIGIAIGMNIASLLLLGEIAWWPSVIPCVASLLFIQRSVAKPY